MQGLILRGISDGRPYKTKLIRKVIYDGSDVPTGELTSGPPRPKLSKEDNNRTRRPTGEAISVHCRNLDTSSSALSRRHDWDQPSPVAV
jgi:hypothetical protein